MERDAAVAYVLVPTHNPTFIAGYYTLSAAQFLLRDLPEEQRRKLPRYPAVPGTLLGRLAVDNTVKGRRLGEQLLVDALHRSLRASRDVASVAVVVDALDEGAAAFYERYGFKRFRDTPLRLFLPMKDIEASFSHEA